MTAAQVVVAVRSDDGLDAYLRPMPVDGEVLRFDLSTFRSTVTRQMLQARLRVTAQAFGVGTDLVAANLTADGSALEVDADGLMAANAAVRARLDAGPEGAVVFLRRLARARAALDRVAGGFAGRLARGARPTGTGFLAYVGAAAHDQALGALKFCLPETLPARLAAWIDDPALVEALLAPEEPTLWSVVSARDLALARLRGKGPAAQYQRRLAQHRQAFGYLMGEDVDFRDHETREAIDARLAALAEGGAVALTTEKRRLDDALAGDRARKAHARRLFAERLATAGEGERDGVATLVSHVLLARAVAAHEDQNRRAKMRLLRDLRDLAEMAGLDLERDGLPAFAAACGPTPTPTRTPAP